MSRKLAITAVVLLLLAGTVAVVWSGLNWPPPLWILEYGLPGSQGPTGRVARIEGLEFVREGARFVEVHPGYVYVDLHSCCTTGSLLERVCGAVDLTSPGHGCPIPIRGQIGVPGWIELPRRFWIADTRVHWDHWTRSRDAAAAVCAELSRRLMLPLRLPEFREVQAISPGELFGWNSDWQPPKFAQTEDGRFGTWGAGADGFRPAFSLTPDQEHLIEPFLVEGK